MEIIYNQYILNIIGLSFDMLGAVLVAWEVSRQFKGKKFHNIGQAQCSDISYSPETEEYKKYTSTKENKMKLGLACLLFGFSLQIISNILTYSN